MEIITSRGMMQESDLTFTKGRDESEDAFVDWEEWRAADGEIVKRSVHVILKRGLSGDLVQGGFG